MKKTIEETTQEDINNAFEQGACEAMSIYYDDQHGIDTTSPEYLAYLANRDPEMSELEKAWFDTGTKIWGSKS